MKKQILLQFIPFWMAFFLMNGCASQNSQVIKEKNIPIKNSEWSKGFVATPLKVDRGSSQYKTAKKKILKLLQNEALRDRQRRVAYVQDTSNYDRYCRNALYNFRNTHTYASTFKICKQRQYQSDLKSLQSPLGKHFKEKHDTVSHYAHFRWNLITKCGSRKKDTTRDLYYGFIEPKDKANEAYFFTSYRTQNECEAVYEKLRRKLQIVERKTIKILTREKVGFTHTGDTY